MCLYEFMWGYTTEAELEDSDISFCIHTRQLWVPTYFTPVSPWLVANILIN
jgi:hypothetical protein